MALRLRFWKSAGLRILLITLFFGFTRGILIYFIKTKNYQTDGDDGIDGSKFECMNVDDCCNMLITNNLLRNHFQTRDFALESEPRITP